MAPFNSSFHWESKQWANFKATVGKHTQEIGLAMHVEGCSHENPFHRVAHYGCIQRALVCVSTTKYHICCGTQRHVVQCIELNSCFFGPNFMLQIISMEIAHSDGLLPNKF